jgi:quinol-cytochrome oxidoreductase complex cytochrome b subunit
MKYEALKLAILSSGQVYLAKLMREMLKIFVDKEYLLFVVLFCFVIYLIVLTYVDRNEGNPYILDVGSKLVVLLMFGTFPTKRLFGFQELDPELQTLIFLIMIALFQVSFYTLPPTVTVKEPKTKVVIVVHHKKKSKYNKKVK